MVKGANLMVTGRDSKSEVDCGTVTGEIVLAEDGIEYGTVTGMGVKVLGKGSIGILSSLVSMAVTG